MTSRKRARVTINISGEVYQTYEKTLHRFPGNLFGVSYMKAGASKNWPISSFTLQRCYCAADNTCFKIDFEHLGGQTIR